MDVSQQHFRTAALVALAAISVYLWWAQPAVAVLWPSLLALLLVFMFRKVELGLLTGAAMGAALLAEEGLWRVPLQLIEVHLLPGFASPWKSGAVLFTLLLGGFVQLLQRAGVLQDFFSRYLGGGSARRFEAGAAGFGLVCFFDGLANSLMVGRIFAPLAGLAKVSRLRLAYIVDTTSAAVACLAVVSTWIAFQLAMIREGMVTAGHGEAADPFRWFFLSWPHNFYALFSLTLMIAAIAGQWHWGPMRKAAAEAARQPAPTDAAGNAGGHAGLWRAVVPLAVLLGVVFGGIWLDGSAQLQLHPLRLSAADFAMAFAEANVPAILILASLLAAATAAWTFPAQRRPEGGLTPVYLEGVAALLRPVVILLCAWMLSSVLRDLQTAAYLGQLLDGRVPLALLPAAVFLCSALVAFSTGTSWGTMGLVMPIAIPVAFALGADPSAAFAILPVVVAAVFSGAVFGDHCSPISDTTIVSSIACSVHPIDHVLTQMPYALTAGAAATGAFLISGNDPSFLSAVLAHLLFLTALFLLEVKNRHSHRPARSTP